MPGVLYGALGTSLGTSELYSFDKDTGEATDIGPIGFAVGAMAVHPTTGVMYAITTVNSDADPNSLITINQASGQGFLIGGCGQEIGDITFAANGTLYAWVLGLDGLCTVNKATGELTSLGADLTGTGVLNRGCGLAIDSHGKMWLFPNGAPSDPDSHYYSVDKTTGEVTLEEVLVGFDNGPDAVISAASFDPVNTLYAIDNSRNDTLPDVSLVTIQLTPDSGEDPGDGDLIPDVGHCRFGAYIEGVSTFGHYYPAEAPWDNAPYSDRTWDRFERDAGRSISMLMFGQPNPWTHVFNYDGAFTATVDRGAICVVDMATFGTPMADVNAGTYDTEIVDWATAAAASGINFILRPNAEMNGTWYDYGLEASGDPSIFVDFWQRIHGLMVGAGATNIQWHWCPNIDPEETHTSMEDLYPGDDYVDWAGFTGYNAGGEPWDWLFAGTYDRIGSITSKPIMIGEIGSVDVGYPGEKLAFLDDMFTKLPTDYPNVRGFCWFNWRVDSEGDPDWPIESSPEAMAAFAAGISSSYYI